MVISNNQKQSIFQSLINNAFNIFYDSSSEIDNNILYINNKKEINSLLENSKWVHKIPYYGRIIKNFVQ